MGFITYKTTNRLRSYVYRRTSEKLFHLIKEITDSFFMAGVESQRRKILVAVDGGEESMYALSWCLNNMVSHHPKDTFILLYVKSPPAAVYAGVDGTGYLFSSEIIAAMGRYSKGLGDSVMEKAERLCAEFDHVVVEKRVESGDARDVICQMTQKLGVDLLVMGSHGYGMIKRALLGSVSNHCAQNVKCPVMIVKRPKSAS